MILEVAVLDVKPEYKSDFKAAFQKAQKIISSMDGYISHQLQQCLEKENRYLLLELQQVEHFQRVEICSHSMIN